MVYFFLLWISLFQLARILFFVYQGFVVGHHPLSYLLGSAWHGLAMDLSMAAYLLVLPCFLMIFTAHSWQWYTPFLTIYHIIISFCVCLIIVADLPVFQAWKFRLDTTPLHYLSQPAEAFASASSSPLLLLSVLFLLIFSALVWIFGNLNQRSIPKFRPVSPLASIFTFSMLTGLLIVPIRGGWGTAPMNQSAVYYSSDHFANQLAVNATWNFFSSVVNKTGSTVNPYSAMGQSQADSLVKALIAKQNKTEAYVTADLATNVLLIIWESLTAKVVSPLGGLHGVTPKFEELAKEGLLFTNFYASGDRSDKGLIAILSGYPSQPTTSIIKYPKKTISLPSLPKTFSENSYHTSFYYGGETEFANMKSYLLQQGYERIVDKHRFAPNQMNSKWGAHDHVVFNRLLADLNKEKTPFFSTIFTLSSHEPYEVPVPTAIPGEDSDHQFLNAHHYTDQSLYDFIIQAKESTWWDNTLIIIVADHGHPLPRREDSRISEFQIPMLWLGGALSKKGVRFDGVASQTDLAATLLSQLGIEHQEYKFSNDIFNQYRTPFAYFSFNDGFGFIKQKGGLVYDNVGKMVIERKGHQTPADLATGQAYLQNSFGDYLKR